jgi:hypothetical protein
VTVPNPPDERSEQKNRTASWIIGVVGALVYLGLLALLWWYLDQYYIKPRNPTERKDLVQGLGLIMAGVAGAIGIFLTWRSQRLVREEQERNQKNTRAQLENAQEELRLTRETQEQNQQNTQAQLENAQDELRLTRQGQMTERFTQAIEQLGSDKLEIKLGGIYSLERTAQEEKNYHWPVMEVLTSYVRRHAARKPDKESRENATTPALDIQAILDVIGRRSEYHRIDKEVEYGTIELNNTDLQGANLKGAYLQRANLQEANLQEANLQEANLQEASLQGANLLGAIVTDEQLADTLSLQGATMPNGQKYEAWLKDKKAKGKDKKNE